MRPASLFILCSLFLSGSCQDEIKRTPDSSYQPDIQPSHFTNSTTITHPYFPIPAGKKYVYEGQTADGTERVEEQRTPDTRVIQGIPCVIVQYKEFLDGHLIEETYDWYAQDNEGNVWYFGEDVKNYNPDGSVRNHAGSWEAGVDGAKAGMIMPANPTTGDRYREEYYFNEAEDEAEILKTGLHITIPFGTFDDCIQTRNWTALEPDANEHKFYAPGIGLIKEVELEDQIEIVLVSIQ